MNINQVTNLTITKESSPPDDSIFGDGQSLIVKVYSYKTINGIKYFSDPVISNSLVIDSDYVFVNIDFTKAINVDGYWATWSYAGDLETGQSSTFSNIIYQYGFDLLNNDYYKIDANSIVPVVDNPTFTSVTDNIEPNQLRSLINRAGIDFDIDKLTVLFADDWDELKNWLTFLNTKIVTTAEKINIPWFPSYSTDDLGNTTYGIEVDDDYVYVVGDNQTLNRYNRSDLSYVDQISPGFGYIRAMCSDSNYIWIAGGVSGSNPCTIKRIRKSDFTVVATDTSLLGTPTLLYADTNYLYANANGLTTIRRFNKTDFTTYVDGTWSGSSVYCAYSDDTHVYFGGGNYNNIRKYLISDMTYVAGTASYGGAVRSIVCDGTYFYAGGQTKRRIRRYLKSDLSTVAIDSRNVGGDIYTLAYDGSEKIFTGGATTGHIFCFNKTNLNLIGYMPQASITTGVINKIAYYDGKIYVANSTTVGGVVCYTVI